MLNFYLITEPIVVGIFVFHGSINLQEAFEASRVMLQRNYIDASFMIRASAYVGILFFVFFFAFTI